jgi:CheY-like chemotaxis protein
VTSASNATDGYALYKSSPPAIVVTDIAMPERDGFWLLEAIRSIASTRPAPVVAVTALAMPNEREQILAAGFAAYVVKPIDLDEVVSIVRRCLARG